MALIPCLAGDQTDPKFGPPGIVATITPKVLMESFAVCTVGSPVTSHGNPYNPKAPGFNPPCAAAFVNLGVPKILVEGKPAAYLGSTLTCGLHFMETIGATRSFYGS